MNNDIEQPYIVVYYGNQVEQLSESQYKAFCEAQDNKVPFVALKDGRRLATLSGFTKIGANPHYVSPESIERTRKKKALWDEYQFLKKEGQLVTIDEYIEWKKKSVKDMKAFQDSLKEHAEGEENEKKRTT